MASPNYPTGFTQGVTIRGVPINIAHPGQVFWVNNSSVLSPFGGRGGSNGNDGSYRSPFSTIDYAIGACTAGRGDIIMVMPGHAETLTAAAAIALDVDGVCIYGLGSGANRPTLTYTTANTASLSWTADYCSIKNIRFVGNFLSIAAPILNSGGAYWTVEDCSFRDTDATHGFLSCVTTTVSTNSDGGVFNNNMRYSDATTTPGTALKVANTTRGLEIGRNRFIHSVAENNVAAVLAHGALVVDDLWLHDNKVYSVNTDTATGGILVTTSATTGSGIIENNNIRALDVAAAILVTATAVQYGMFNILYTGETSLASGFVLPAIATDA